MTATPLPMNGEERSAVPSQPLERTGISPAGRCCAFPAVLSFSARLAPGESDFFGAIRVENSLRNNRLPTMSSVLWAVIACGVLAVLYGVITASRVMAADAGTPRMQEIAQAVQEGA